MLESLSEIQRRLMVSFGPAYEIQTLQREIQAWRERFPKFHFNSLDDLIERKSNPSDEKSPGQTQPRKP